MDILRPQFCVDLLNKLQKLEYAVVDQMQYKAIDCMYKLDGLDEWVNWMNEVDWMNWANFMNCIRWVN